MAIELLISGGVYFHPGHFYDFRFDGFLVVSLIVHVRTSRWEWPTRSQFSGEKAQRRLIRTIRKSLRLHNLVDDVRLTYSLWDKLVLKRAF